MSPRGPAALWLAVVFMGGIWLSSQVAVSHAAGAAAGAGFLLVWPTVRCRSWLRGVLLITLCLTAGMLYTRAYQYLPPDHIVHRARDLRYRPLTVEGVVVSEIRTRAMVNTVKTSFTLKLRNIMAGERAVPVSGRVLVNLFEPVPVTYGDCLRVTGKLHAPFEFSGNDNFSYRRYLQNKGIHSVLSVKRGNPVDVTGRDKFYRWRAVFLDSRNALIALLKRYLTDNETGVMQAILLGERSAIPSHVRELFIRTGTAHVLAVSGLHVGIVVLMLMIVLQVLRLPRPVQQYLTVIFILMYVLLTGARPSIMRAAIMSIVFIGSLIHEREANSLAMLSCASLLILLLNPLNLYDIGFQLSFACILAMIVIGRPIEGWMQPLLERRGCTGWLRRLVRAVIISSAVWIGVEGLVMYHFNLMTPVSVLANLFVIPLIFAVVLLGMALLAAALCWPWLAGLIAVCLKAALSVMVAVTFLCSRLPGAYFYIRPLTVWELGVYYLIIGMIFGLPWGIIWSKFTHRRVRSSH
ncbi:MAG: ComEC family competence protein [Candidatus Omnitrophica bacterium]|nr:ComEC family competence protein [Candidatus Omnitrophota bacterium]